MNWKHINTIIYRDWLTHVLMQQIKKNQYNIMIIYLKPMLNHRRDAASLQKPRLKQENIVSLLFIKTKCTLSSMFTNSSWFSDYLYDFFSRSLDLWSNASWSHWSCRTECPSSSPCSTKKWMKAKSFIKSKWIGQWW